MYIYYTRHYICSFLLALFLTSIDVVAGRSKKPSKRLLREQTEKANNQSDQTDKNSIVSKRRNSDKKTETKSWRELLRPTGYNLSSEQKELFNTLKVSFSHLPKKSWTIEEEKIVAQATQLLDAETKRLPCEAVTAQVVALAAKKVLERHARNL